MAKYFHSLIFILSLFLIVSCSTESTPVYNLGTYATPEEGGTVTPDSGEYDEGTSVEITATANEGWVFNGWQGQHSGSQNPDTIIMNSDKEISALFEKREYPLTIDIEGEGTVDEKILQQKTTDYPHGTLVELTANPAEGWKFIKWHGDVDSEEDVIEVNIDGDTNITVTFERLDYPLTITIEGEGEVDQRVVQSKTTDYPEGTVLELEAIAEENWVFSEWSGDVTGEDNPATITIDEPKTVTATFLRTYQLTTIAEPEEGGNVTPTDTVLVRDSDIKVEAIANEGWHFTSWEGDFSGSVNPFSLTMNGNKTILANFERNEYELNIEVEGDGEVVVELLSGTETKNGYLYESTVEIEAIPEERMTFIGWDGDISSDENPLTISMTDNTNLTALFSPYNGGEGTASQPYQISNIQQFQNIELNLDAHYKIVNDIDASETKDWDEGFRPIGSVQSPFNGHLDGKEFTIYNLNINATRDDSDVFNFGVFEVIGEDGHVLNQNYQQASYSVDCLAGCRTGGLAGINYGSIEEVHVEIETANPEANSDFGGLVGINEGTIIASTTSGRIEVFGGFTGGFVALNRGEILHSTSSVDTYSHDGIAGGFVGRNLGHIESSTAYGNGFSNENSGGGFVGWNEEDGKITKSQSFGNSGSSWRDGGGFVSINNGIIVQSSSFGNTTAHDAGGFVSSNRGEILQSYAQGDVYGESTVAGFGFGTGIIEASYSTGKITSIEYSTVHGFGGGAITYSYWDMEASNITNGGDDSGVTGLTTDQMKGANAEKYMEGFDFENVWITTDGYPILRWQNE